MRPCGGCMCGFLAAHLHVRTSTNLDTRHSASFRASASVAPPGALCDRNAAVSNDPLPSSSPSPIISADSAVAARRPPSWTRRVMNSESASATAFTGLLPPPTASLGNRSSIYSRSLSPSILESDFAVAQSRPTPTLVDEPATTGMRMQSSRNTLCVNLYMRWILQSGRGSASAGWPARG